MWMLPANTVFKAFLNEELLDETIAQVISMPTVAPSGAEPIAPIYKP